jgi:methyl-accepting chemotaxis protein
MDMGERPESKQAQFISLRWKLLIVLTLLFSIVFIASFYWFYQFSINSLENRIKADLLNTIEGAANGVSGELLVELAAEGVPNDSGGSDHPNFNFLMSWLETVHAIEPRAWPYLAVLGKGDTDIIYMADLKLLPEYDSSQAAVFGETGSSDYVRDASKGLLLRPGDNGGLTYTDKWGSWASAYGPVYNGQGEVVGLIGLDFEAEVVKELETGLRLRVLQAGAIAYLILLVLVYLISNALTGPIIRLTQMAEEIGDGRYEGDFSVVSKGGLRDEIDKLADVFAVMVGKVYQREQNLMKEVQKLKIEIDETRRKKHVQEIVETDFFKDLQSKAKDMRQRRQSQ